MELKVTKIGNSLGVILPKDVLARLKLDKGDSLFITETPDGYRLVPYDPAFAEQMQTARALMKKRRNVLHELNGSEAVAFTLLRDGMIQAIHAEAVSTYGGRTGLRELSMLKMLHARAGALNMSSATDLASLAACYGYGLAHDQLFYDANQPTALVVIELLLNLNGYALSADDTTCFLGLQVVADGELSAEAFASWIRTHIVPQAA